MKQKKHDRLVREAVARAVAEALAQRTAEAVEANTRRTAEQTREDLALIAAGMIPVRVLRRYALRGSANLVHEFGRDMPPETTYSVRFLGSDPVVDAAFRAIDANPDELPF